MKRYFSPFIIGASCFFYVIASQFTPQALGQFTRIYNVPPDNAPFAIFTDNTQLNIFNNGYIDFGFLSGLTDGSSENIEINLFDGAMDDTLTVYGGTTLNVMGGSIGERMVAGSLVFLPQDVEINISGGSIDDDFTAHSGAVITMTDGSIGSGFEAGYWTGGVEVNMSGGSIGGSCKHNYGTINISGGSVGALFFCDGSNLNISGGTINDFVLLSHCTVEISGDVVFRDSVTMFLDTTATMTDGEIGNGLVVRTGSTLNFVDGSIGQSMVVDNATLNMSGGSISNNLFVKSGSVGNFDGGTTRNGVTAEPGSQVSITGGQVATRFRAEAGSLLTISGGDFKVNNVSVSAGAVNVPIGQLLTGVFSDGTVFVFRNGGLQNPLTRDLLADGTTTLIETSIPPQGPTVINAPVDPIPHGLRPGQTLNMDVGAESGRNFTAIESEINLMGGLIAQGLELVNSNLNLFSGSIDRTVRFHGASTAQIMGGTVFFDVEIYDESVVAIAGGTLASPTIYDGAVLKMTSGSLSTSVLWPGATLNLSGGTVNGVHAPGDTDINLAGTQFQLFELNSTNLIEDLTPSIQNGDRVEVTQRDVTLVATLLDGTVNSFNLNSSYVSNDDLFLPTANLTIGLSLGQVVIPDSLIVNRGFQAAGGLGELAESDNIDLSIRRSTTDVQALTEFEISSTTLIQAPGEFQFTLEASVFARTEVLQTIMLFDFDAAEFVEVDAQPAQNFVDKTVTFNATGDLARFVQDGTGVVKAKVRFVSINPRQQFSSNIDQAVWSIGL